jgi:hypothetical protein
VAFYCNLLIKEPLSTEHPSKAARHRVANLMIFAFSFNIEDINDENETTIIDFDLNNLTIPTKGNGFNRKIKGLLSKENIMLKKLPSD